MQKVLAQAGVSSRRGAEQLIVQGKVMVNGKLVSELGTKVDPEKDNIVVDGKRIRRREPKLYLLLNKPAGYVTTLKDPQGRRKVTDLLKGVKTRVYPVGRLDYETEGLLLLTNDGELTYRLTHPKHGVEKTYLASVVGVPDLKKMRLLREGVRLEDGVTAPAQVRRLAVIEGNALLELKIHEGRNRQVRRMCGAIGHPVIKLQRTAIAGLTLDGLALGTYRSLSEQEVASLIAKLPKGKLVANHNFNTAGKTQQRSNKPRVEPKADGTSGPEPGGKRTAGKSKYLHVRRH